MLVFSVGRTFWRHSESLQHHVCGGGLSLPFRARLMPLFFLLTPDSKTISRPVYILLPDGGGGWAVKLLRAVVAGLFKGTRCFSGIIFCFDLYMYVEREMALSIQVMLHT